MVRQTHSSSENQMPPEFHREEGLNSTLLFENHPQPMWVYDVERLRFLAVNKAAVDYYGYSRDEFLGMTIVDIRPPEQRPMVREAICHAPEGYHRVGTWRHWLKNGHEAYAEVVRHSVLFEGRRAELELINDVSGLQSLEAELKKRSRNQERQQEALALLVESEPMHSGDTTVALQHMTETVAKALEVERVSVWRFNEDRSAIVSQDLYEASTRRHSSGAELKAADFPSYFGAMSLKKVIAADDAATDERTCEFAECYLKPLGITSMLDAPVFNQGVLSGVLCIENVGPARHWTHADQGFALSIGNLVSLVISQQALAESDARARAVVENEPECVKVVSLDGRLLEMNWAGLKMIEAYRFTEIIGCPVLELVHPQDRNAYWDLHQRSAAGESDRLEFRIIGLQGTERWMETHSAPMRDASGAITSVLSVTRDITEQRRAQEALQASEQRYRMLFEDNPQPMWVYDLETLEFLAVNDAAVSHYGYSRDEFLQMTIEGIRPAEDVVALHENIAAAGDGFDTAGIWRHRLRNGRIIQAEISSHTLDFDGRRAKLVMASDVTEFKEAQDRLSRKGALLRIAGKLARVGGWAVTLRGQDQDEVFWSDEMYGIMEFPQGEMPPALEGVALFLPDSLERLDVAMKECIAGGEPFDLDLQVHTAKGRLLTVRCRGEAERDAKGTITRVSGAFQDITEMRRLENESHRVADQLSATLEGMSDAFILVDPEWKFVYMNGEAERVLRRTREELIGRDMWDEFPEGRHTEAFEKYHRAVADNKPVNFRMYYPPLEEWLEISASPSEEGLAVYFRVITERIALEEQLRQSQRLDSVGQLTGGVAHDFNNLLTVIMGNAELLVDELPETDDRRQLAEMIYKAAQGGADLISRLLAFARRQALDPKPVDASDLLHRMNKLLRRSLGEHIEIDFVHGEGLWKAMVDPSQLENAVLNLCINARDAMPNGGRLTIETANVWLDRDYADQNVDVRPGPYVMVAVTDRGIGIQPECLSRVFEPFYTTKAHGKGTGLGLSMVYGFVKQSHGHIKIYSEPGEGTVVKLYLPRMAGEWRDADRLSDIAAMPRGAEVVLLVEDEEMVRSYSSGQLSALGYTVVVTTNGPEAMEVLRERDDFDLLFTDVIMPGGMNGRQLADAAREFRPDLKVLYTSGYSDDAIVHQGRLDAGAHLLSKPYGRAQLANKIREVLDA